MAVYTWGFGKYGQLGTGQSVGSETPQLIKLPPNATPMKIACGAHFTAVLCNFTKKGGAANKLCRVFTCGWGKYGRLGTGSEEDRNLPTEILIESGIDVSEIAAGHWHACCITTDGSLYSWGYNKSHGVLGLAGVADSKLDGGVGKPMPTFEPIPRKIPTPHIRFKSVACGYNFTYAISADGKCFSWGCGKHGVLGHGDTSDCPQPSLVDGVKDKSFKQISCGYSHAALVEVSGALYTVGSGEDGALGHGGRDKSDKHIPTVIRALGGVTVVNASCSHGEHHAHTLACTSDGNVYSWGDGYKGKLGHGNQESCSEPTKIDSTHFLGQRVVQVSCGGIHSAACTEEGHVFTWGCGSDGRLGHPEAKGHRYLFRSDVPRLVEGVPKSVRVREVACSYYHSAVLCIAKVEQ